MERNPAPKRFNSINSLLIRRFGERVYKVSLESGLGCPNRDGISSGGCIFCNAASYQVATEMLAGASPREIHRQLDDGIDYVRRRHRADKFIAYFQSGTNTNGDVDLLSSIFHQAIDHAAVVGLAVSTRPDCIGEAHARLFKELSKKTFFWVEIGLQSAHDSSLDLIGRGHRVSHFTQANELLSAYGIPVCAHIILGLPGETPSMMLETARFLNRMNVWGVKIHNLHVLRGTRLEHIYNEGGLKIPSLEEYAGWAVGFLEILDPAIVIHRVNSHSPRHLTIAPDWSINKLAIFNEVERQLCERDTWQGKRFEGKSKGPGLCEASMRKLLSFCGTTRHGAK